MYYALINNDRRISAMSPFNDVFPDIKEGYSIVEIEGEMPFFDHDIIDYKVTSNGKVVYDQLPEEEKTIELPNNFITTEDLADEFSQFTKDYDSVVCELYEQSMSQQNLLAEQDAAICELYELAISA